MIFAVNLNFYGIFSPFYFVCQTFVLSYPVSLFRIVFISIFFLSEICLFSWTISYFCRSQS